MASAVASNNDKKDDDDNDSCVESKGKPYFS